MGHWEMILKRRFMTVQYEDLVAGFDDAAPRLVAFCGLEWEEGCRNFSTTSRIIATMSAVQARKPLNGFRGRGGRYAAFLSPLIAALRDAGVDIRSGTIADKGTR
jgi:Sulfotransferase family